MSASELGPIEIQRLSGDEAFHRNGILDDFNVQDFWAWSASDLVTNATRGVLAEYLVAKAIGLSTEKAREEWGAFDLETDDGLRIEVKSSAYIQSWAQTKLTTIQFEVSKRLGWDSKTAIMESIPRRHADVYVFALLAHKDQSTIDPLDLTQWQFWAVPTNDLDGRTRSQHSITLGPLRELAGEPVDYWGLAEVVRQAAARQRDGVVEPVEA